MRVTEVWRYPVKSMQGESLKALTIGKERIPGDREWGVRDSVSGDVLTARATRRLLQAAAQVDEDGEVCITLPDGRVLREDDATTDLALSSFVGQPVHLAHAKSDEQARFETMSEFSTDTPTLVQWASKKGSFNDGAAVHVLTTASLRAASAMHPEGAWTARRFRPNLVVDVDDDGFVEDAWTALRIGDVELEIFKRATRCSITARAQPGLAEDVEIPRTLARNRNAKLGVYAHVRVPGTIAAGAVVHPT
jgi:uncharacterized protein